MARPGPDFYLWPRSAGGSSEPIKGFCTDPVARRNAAKTIGRITESCSFGKAVPRR